MTRSMRSAAATARGDEAQALGIWQTCYSPPPDLEARRVDLTRELAAAGAGQRFLIEFIEWWRTCCEPGIIDDRRNAGRARIFVIAGDRVGARHGLVFEVLTKDGAYWGDAAGNPRHDWTLREVYRRGEQSLRKPVIVPLTRDDAIRSSRSLAPVPANATFEAKRMSLGDLRALLGPQDFLPPADPTRSVWVVARERRERWWPAEGLVVCGGPRLGRAHRSGYPIRGAERPARVLRSPSDRLMATMRRMNVSTFAGLAGIGAVFSHVARVARSVR